METNAMNPILKSLLVFVFLAAAGFAADTPMVAEWWKKAEAGDAKFQELMGECYADNASSDGVQISLKIGEVRVHDFADFIHD